MSWTGSSVESAASCVCNSVLSCVIVEASFTVYSWRSGLVFICCRVGSVGWVWGLSSSGCIIGGVVLPYNSKFKL